MHYIIDGTFEGRIFTKSLNTGFLLSTPKSHIVHNLYNMHAHVSDYIFTKISSRKFVNFFLLFPILCLSHNNTLSTKYL